MKTQDVRILAETLSAAVAEAEARGDGEIDIGDMLRAADDKARSDLQAWIDAQAAKAADTKP